MQLTLQPLGGGVAFTSTLIQTLSRAEDTSLWLKQHGFTLQAM